MTTKSEMYQYFSNVRLGERYVAIPVYLAKRVIEELRDEEEATQGSLCSKCGEGVVVPLYARADECGHSRHTIETDTLDDDPICLDSPLGRSMCVDCGAGICNDRP